MVDWLAQMNDVTDPEQRADLARWVVALRRAHAAGTPQTTGALTHLRGAARGAGHCCLGIWCVIKVADGTLDTRVGNTEVLYARANYMLGDLQGAQLPNGALLGNSSDPDLLRIIERSAAGDGTLEGIAMTMSYTQDNAGNIPDVEKLVRREATETTAAVLNDDDGLNFDQIADVVTWRYGITPEELAVAEAAPRVPEVEGPADDGPEILPF